MNQWYFFPSSNYSAISSTSSLSSFVFFLNYACSVMLIQWPIPWNGNGSDNIDQLKPLMIASPIKCSSWDVTLWSDSAVLRKAPIELEPLHFYPWLFSSSIITCKSGLTVVRIMYRSIGTRVWFFYLTVIRSSILMKTAESLLIILRNCWSWNEE